MKKVNEVMSVEEAMQLIRHEDPAGVPALSKALKNDATTTTLYLDMLDLDDKGAAALAEALKVNHTLKEAIGDEGAVALVDALKINCTLTALDLSCNIIGDQVAAALAEALAVNCTLKVLNLYYNSIGDQVVAELSEVLKINCTLKVLNLGDNMIGEGAVALEEASRAIAR